MPEETPKQKTPNVLNVGDLVEWSANPAAGNLTRGVIQGFRDRVELESDKLAKTGHCALVKFLKGTRFTYQLWLPLGDIQAL